VRVTNFEIRHPILIHELIIFLGFSMYLLDREDIVWRFIKQSPNRRLLEHAFFFLAAILIGLGAAFCTRSRAKNEMTGMGAGNRKLLGEWIFAIGLSSLAPLVGCILLIAGEGFRLLRLACGIESAQARNQSGAAPADRSALPSSHSQWTGALRREAAKWGLFITICVFAMLLIDRLAEIMAGASVVVWMLMNMFDWIRETSSPAAQQR